MQQQGAIKWKPPAHVASPGSAEPAQQTAKGKAKGAGAPPFAPAGGKRQAASLTTDGRAKVRRFSKGNGAAGSAGMAAKVLATAASATSGETAPLPARHQAARAIPFLLAAAAVLAKAARVAATAVAATLADA